MGRQQFATTAAIWSVQRFVPGVTYPTYLAVVASKGAHAFTGVGVVDGQGDAVDCGKVLPAIAEAHVTAALDGDLLNAQMQATTQAQGVRRTGSRQQGITS